MRSIYEDDTKGMKEYFVTKKDLEKRARAVQRDKRTSHKCSGCPFGRFVNDNHVFCLWPTTCVKEGGGTRQ